MCSDWSLREAKFVFGEEKGQLVWDKMFTETGRRRDSLVFFGSLDENCKAMLVNRVNELYPIRCKSKAS